MRATNLILISLVLVGCSGKISVQCKDTEPTLNPVDGVDSSYARYAMLDACDDLESGQDEE